LIVNVLGGILLYLSVNGFWVLEMKVRTQIKRPKLEVIENYYVNNFEMIV